MIQEIGGAEGDRWRCRRLFYVVLLKDPKHVLQDESLYEPCFFNTSYVFRWSLSKCQNEINDASNQRIGIGISFNHLHYKASASTKWYISNMSL